MSVTIRDVARSLNLSHTTVSRVLNDRDAISIPHITRERVRTAAKQMGYSPNRSARALVTGRTNLVALQIYRLTSPYAWMVSQQLQDNATRDGYEVVTREFGRGDLTLQSSVDGILALDTFHLPQDTARLTVPYVMMGMLPLQHLHLDYVGVDFEYGARLAVEHLIRSGKRRIAHMTIEALTKQEEARFHGYRMAMEEAGLPAEFVITPSLLRHDGYGAMLAYAAQHGVPDAVFCLSDELAAGCLRALHELGRRIPEQTAVIGYDGLNEGEYLQPALSTVLQPVEEMCRVAWKFLRRRMQEPDAPPQTALLKPSLLLRASA